MKKKWIRLSKSLHLGPLEIALTLQSAFSCIENSRLHLNSLRELHQLSDISVCTQRD